MEPTAKGNPFVHLELNTPDAGKAKEFYGKLFGWEFQENDMGAPVGMYSTFKPANGPGGGIFSLAQGNVGWTAYIGVEDINAATEKAKGLGAEIMMGCNEIPNVGWMTVMKDPTGCVIALFQPISGQTM
jgi:predicted enzyme related to lactoylglutathione lyase